MERTIPWFKGDLMRGLTTSLMLLVALGSFAQEMLTADEAVRIALEQNYGIRLARIDVQSADLLNNPGQAGMLPTLDGVGSYTVDNSSTKQVLFSGDVRQANNANIRVLDAALMMNWTVFDGLTMFATKDRLEALELIGETQLRQQIEATTYDVLSAYYQVVQLRKAIALQRESVRISRERFSIAEAGKRIGSASGLAVVQAQLDLSADSANVLTLQVQEVTSGTRLNALMGRDPATPLSVANDVGATDQLDLAQLQQAARQANSALQQARQQQIAADLNVKELRGTLMPKLDLFGNYGYTKLTSAVGLLQSNQSTGPDYGARISIPLFHGMQLNRALQVAQLEREQAAIGTQQVQLDLEESLLNTWTAHTMAMQRAALEEGNLVGSRTQVDVALESYRLGAITSLELRDVQLGLIAAESRLLLARYEAKVAELQLKWLAGSLV